MVRNCVFCTGALALVSTAAAHSNDAMRKMVGSVLLLFDLTTKQGGCFVTIVIGGN